MQWASTQIILNHSICFLKKTFPFGPRAGKQPTKVAKLAPVKTILGRNRNEADDVFLVFICFKYIYSFESLFTSNRE